MQWGLKALTHRKPSRRLCMRFFDVLPFTDDTCVVNGKTSKKSVQNRRDGFWCVNALRLAETFTVEREAG